MTEIDDDEPTCVLKSAKKLIREQVISDEFKDKIKKVFRK